MSDHNQDERAAPDEYENGPEGMPRVKRMPSAVLDCIIDHSLFRYLGGALEGEDRDRLYGLMHDTANEALARISAWPVAPAVGEDGLPPLPAPKYPQMKVLIHGSTSEQCGYTAEQYRQGQLDAVAAYKRKHAALQEMVDIAQECDMGYRSPACAAQGVKTWRERLLRGYGECDQREAMESEIAELRAQLARKSQEGSCGS